MVKREDRKWDSLWASVGEISQEDSEETIEGEVKKKDDLAFEM